MCQSYQSTWEDPGYTVECDDYKSAQDTLDSVYDSLNRIMRQLYLVESTDVELLEDALLEMCESMGYKWPSRAIGIQPSSYPLLRQVVGN